MREFDIIRAVAAAAVKSCAEDDDFETLKRLLRDHINNHMDQFTSWKIKDAIGNDVYIKISYLPDGGLYDDLDRP